MKSLMYTKIRFSFILFLLSMSLVSFAQTGTLTGKVKDSNGESIIGASILVIGTTTGTITDIDGNYTLEVPAGELEFSISYVGYLTENQKVTVAEGAVHEYSVTLVEDMLQLEDVIVIGYGTQKRSDLTGAVASVSSDQLNQTSVTSVSEALQGRAAGVQTAANTGAPGAKVNIKIRGITSVNGTDPVWIVDGIPSDPNTVNPSDIESLEILKDASAGAIYGAAAANGVVLITTKRGKKGKLQTTFNTYLGMQEVTNKIDVASGPEFGQMYTEYEAQLYKRTHKYNPDTLDTYDYQDMIFRRAPMQNYDLGVSGGNETSKFYMGLGYVKQEGILKGTSYERITLRVNSDHKVHKWLTFGQNFSFTSETRTGFEEWELFSEYATPIVQALSIAPMTPPYREDGPKYPEYENDPGWSASMEGGTQNPLATIGLNNKELNDYKSKLNVFGSITPFKGFEYKTVFSAGVDFKDISEFSPRYFLTASNLNTSSSIKRRNEIYRTFTWQNYVTYNTSLFSVHNISAVVGMESSAYKSQWQEAERYDLINESEEMWYFNASRNDTLLAQLPNGSAEEGKGYSYFGRLSYDYKSMFLLQANIRKDYSSKFGPNNRSGLFPSFSVGFKFTELAVVKNTLPFLNFGKIRYGWGGVGANYIRPYSYYSTVALERVYQYPFTNSAGASTGAAKNQVVNLSTKWEEVVTRNLGVDLAFLQNKLTLTADYFSRYNKDMLLETAIPTSAGYLVRQTFQEGGSSLPVTNVGKISNKGLELTIGWKDSFKKFSYSANFNFTYVKTKTEALANVDTLFSQDNTRGMLQYLSYSRVGYPIGEYHGYIVDGIFREADTEIIDGDVVVTNQPYTIDEATGERFYAQPNAQPGDFIFKDLNSDGKIDRKDVGPIGNPNPTMLFGLNLEMSYGWFDMVIFLQGTYGNKIFNHTKYYLFNQDAGFNWSSDYVNDHYIYEDLYDRQGNLVAEANNTAQYPRLDVTNSNENFRASSFYIEDASFLRLKTLQFGVTIPNKYTEKVNIERFRLYVAAKNLVTWTKYSGYDPEVGGPDVLSQGLDKAAYPAARLYTVGLNLNF